MGIDEYMARNLKDVQKLAYDCAETVFAELEEGMTEIEAAKMMKDHLDKHCVKKYFHRPFAWFGDRTLFKNFSRPLPFLRKKTWKDLKFPDLDNLLPHFGLEFLPTKRKLEKNMAVILDVAPVRGNFFADIGYSNYFGESSDFEKMKNFLKRLKNALPEIVKENRKISSIYREVDNMLFNAGYSNCHQLYPLGVLGHKVGLYPSFKHFKLPRLNIFGFEPEAFIFLIKQNPTAPYKYNDRTPFIASDIDEFISDGFWAIEPHIGLGEIGAKFEEILIVDGENVRWLSES